MKSRVALVDDHPVFRQGLAALVATDPALEPCGEAATAEEALGLIEAEHPDLVIADLFLRDRLSLDFIAEVARRWPALPVLVVSMYEEDVFAARALKAGARGYVMKGEASDLLLAAIRAVLDGQVHLSRAASQKVLGSLAGFAGEASPVERLTDREMEVFRLMGRGLSTKRIAAVLGISVKTVEAHRAQLKTKMGARDVYDLVRLAVTWGAEPPAGTLPEG